MSEFLGIDPLPEKFVEHGQLRWQSSCGQRLVMTIVAEKSRSDRSSRHRLDDTVSKTFEWSGNVAGLMRYYRPYMLRTIIAAINPHMPGFYRTFRQHLFEEIINRAEGYIQWSKSVSVCEQS